MSAWFIRRHKRASQALMSKMDSEPDIEACRFNVAEVSLADVQLVQGAWPKGVGLLSPR
jgi:hypothetical protein